MNTDLFGTLTLVGLKVRLDRPIDIEHPCCENVCTIGAGRGPHIGELVCTGCGKHRGWLSRQTAQCIESVATRFGAPEIITVRQAHTYETSPEEQQLRDKQERINQINALIAAEGFAPKDFLLTQLPPPYYKNKAAYAKWRARELRRRPIAQRMALWGLTAHDLSVARKPPTATAEEMSPITATERQCNGQHRRLLS
jgi:hypothetical protein